MLPDECRLGPGEGDGLLRNRDEPDENEPEECGLGARDELPDERYELPDEREEEREEEEREEDDLEEWELELCLFGGIFVTLLKMGQAVWFRRFRIGTRQEKRRVFSSYHICGQSTRPKRHVFGRIRPCPEKNGMALRSPGDGMRVHDVLEKTKPEPSTAGPVLKGGAAE